MIKKNPLLPPMVWLYKTKHMEQAEAIDFRHKKIHIYAGDDTDFKNCIILQNTGLEDHFKNSLYDGDIIDVFTENWYAPNKKIFDDRFYLHYDENNQLVVTNKLKTSKNIKYKNDLYDLDIHYLLDVDNEETRYFVKKGNIYENPELLDYKDEELQENNKWENLGIKGNDKRKE